MTEQRTATWRRIIGPLCVALGCIMLALAIVATWIKLTALDTDTYVDTVAPLVRDEAVSTALATGVVERVFERVDVEAVVQDVLPSQAQALSAPLVAVLQQYAVQLVEGIIRSDQFATVWTEANRIVHTQLVRILTDELVSEETTDRVQTAVLDLRGVIERLDEGLQARGIDLFEGRGLPEDAGQFVVATRQQLDTARQAVDILDTVAFALPILALIFFAIALWISRGRARTLMWIGLGSIITLAIGAVVLRMVRRHYIGGIPNELRRAAADSIWDGVFHGLRVQLFVAVLGALIVAFAGWFMGSSRAAAAGRQGIRDALARWRGGAPAPGASAGAITRFVRRFRRPLQLASVGIALIVLLAAPKATVGLVLLATLIVVVVLLLVEFIAGPGPEEPALAQSREVDVGEEPQR